MKYYCKNCETIVEIGERLYFEELNLFGDGMICPFSESHGEMEIISNYEIPAQYWKRTGKAYSDNGLVFFRRQEFVPDTNFNKMKWGEWEFYTYKIAKEILERCIGLGKLCEIVIADPPVPPSDDWKQKEVL